VGTKEAARLRSRDHDAMSETKTNATESSRAVVLTAASLIAAIMIERLVGRLGELSSGQVLWGSTSGSLVQSALVLVAIVNWWEFYATVTSVGRWVLSPLDLLAPIGIGAVALLMIENLSKEVTTEFLALATIAFLGGVLASRTVVAGMKRGAPQGPGPFDSYPDRWVELLFVGIAMLLGTACFLCFTTAPQPAVLNTLILLAASLDAAIVFLQLRWWSRTTRAP
jgi:hypothetical protein